MNKCQNVIPNTFIMCDEDENYCSQYCENVKNLEKNLMKITFNGKEIEVEKGISIADILKSNGYELKFVLVQVDEKTIDHHDYYVTKIEEEGTEIDADYLCGGGSM